MSVFWRPPTEWEREPYDPPGERPAPEEILSVLEWLVAQRRLGLSVILDGVHARPSRRALVLVLTRLEHYLRQVTSQPPVDEAQLVPLVADLARLRFAAGDGRPPARPLAVYTRRAQLAVSGIPDGLGVTCWG